MSSAAGIELAGQQCLLLGECSDIDIACALRASAAGALVTIASASRAKLDASLAAIGGVARGVVLDRGDGAAVERFFIEAAPWDHVVVSAPHMSSGSMQSLDLDAAYAAMEAKFWSAYRIARAAKIRSGGSLTFISDTLSVRSLAHSAPQRAIIGALEGLARGMASERAPVRVNTISPGVIVGPRWPGMSDARYEAMLADAARRLPGGQIGRPEDVAGALFLLATTASITGSTVHVDGDRIVVPDSAPNGGWVAQAQSAGSRNGAMPSGAVQRQRASLECEARLDRDEFRPDRMTLAGSDLIPL